MQTVSKMHVEDEHSILAETMHLNFADFKNDKARSHPMTSTQHRTIVSIVRNKVRVLSTPQRAQKSPHLRNNEDT